MILAIEQSTSTGTIAIVNDNDVIAEASWKDGRFEPDNLFSKVPDLLQTAQISISDVDIFAAGLGPGSFAGLRISLSSLRAMALPDKKPVVGISSGEILAFDIFKETQSEVVTIIGDARRQMLWHAEFTKTDDTIKITSQYELISATELTDKVNQDGIIASPDWNAIGQTIKEHLGNVKVIEEDRTPTAKTLAKMAINREGTTEPSEIISPIYLHPPVFTKSSK